jgi:4'-phosphopantetheinyl transferase EntD
VTLRSTDRLALAHGACVIVELADLDAATAALPVDEQARAEAYPPARRGPYVAGRTALHLALDSRAPIASNDRGAPILPDGWVGSISHKGALAAALVAPAGAGVGAGVDAGVGAGVGAGFVGVDLERAAAPRVDIASRVLTPRELAVVPDRGRAVTLRFSIKEAIYKAIDPFVRRYVGFLEVELDFTGDAVTVTTELPFAIEATWREHAGHWLTTARATRHPA